MDESFWHKKWQTGEIGFHESQPNTLLVSHFEKLNLAKGSRIFLPLCGKTRDIAWLLANGYCVAGAELSEIAVIQLFEELGVTPSISPRGKLSLYAANGIDIFVGNIFDLTAELLGNVDAVYDRAALVALPDSMRKQYTSHLMSITQMAPQLLIAFEYDQHLIDGPPFSINATEVEYQYAEKFQRTAVETRDVEGGLKGKVPAVETVWLLTKFASTR